MTIAEFLNNFDVLAETPNGISSLRPLILHYAFHGALTDYDAADEPAKRLLARSRAAMAEQMAEGNGKREKPASPVAEAEQTFPLPAGWVWCRLVDTGQFINGLAFKPSDWGPTGRPIIRIQNLSGRNSEYNRTTGEFDPDVLVQDGDVLVSWSATLDAFIWRGEEGVLNQHIFRVLPSPLVDKRFLYWLLKWVIRQLAESDHAHGLVMTHINRGPFLAHAIPIPPLAEQTRIVAKVDELMAVCDRLEAQQQQREEAHAALSHAALARFADAPTAETLKYLTHESYAIAPPDLRMAILAAAVRGRLFPQQTRDRLAITELNRCRKELGRDEWSPPEGTLEEAPFELPASWCWVTVDAVADSRLGKMLDVEKNRGEPHPYLRNTNVHWFRFELDSIKTMLFDPSEVEEFRVRTGDVLICEGGHGIARAAVWEDQLPGMTFQKALHRVRPLPCLDPYFFTFCIRVFEAEGHLQGYYTGAGIPHFTGKSLAKVLFPLPPHAEQRRIVAKVNDLMALVNRLEADLAVARATGERLMDAVVAELTA